MRYRVALTVNGEPVEAEVAATTSLLNLLRYRLGLTGTKKGCDTGECGACTVLLEGEPVCSCITLALSASGCRVTTVEGLAENGKLHPLQAAFVERWGLQCGACTAGMLMSAAGLLCQNPNPTPAEVREAIAGNLCRCTGYHKIVESVLIAAARMRDAATLRR